ncbi:MAG: hypothetical protein ACOC93_03420 [Planctomycetota bacterium]
MRHRRMWQLFGVALVALSLVAVGCQQEEVTVEGRQAPPPPRDLSGVTEVSETDGNLVATSYLPTFDEDTSQVRVELTMPQEAQVGQTFDYTIRATNIAGIPLRNVVVLHEFPENFEPIEVSRQGQMDEAGMARWELGAMGPGQTETIRVRGQATDTGQMQACTDVLYDLPQICLTTRVTRPELEITKTAPDRVIQCDPIPVTLTVRNTGTGTAQDVVVTDDLADGLVTEDDQTELTWRVGDLAPDQSEQREFMVRAERTGQFRNVARVESAGGVTAESVATQTTVVRPELQVTKSGPQRHYIGRPITYRLTVTNQGDGVARNTQLVDQVPNGANFLEASDGGSYAGGQVTWDLGTLQPGDSQEVSMSINPTDAGTLDNRAIARADCAEDKTAQLATAVRGIPAILVECIDLEDPVPVGTNTRYQIIVTNQGSAVSQGITLTAMLPEEMDYVSADGPTQAQPQNGQINFDRLEELPPGETATWTVTARGTEVGEVLFEIEVASDRIEVPVRETEATNIYDPEQTDAGGEPADAEQPEQGQQGAGEEAGQQMQEGAEEAGEEM